MLSGTKPGGVVIFSSAGRGPTENALNEGALAEFVCEADGDPTPIIEWRLDGGGDLPIGSTVVQSGGRSTLSVPNIDRTLCVECVASNAEGTASNRQCVSHLGEFVLTLWPTFLSHSVCKRIYVKNNNLSEWWACALSSKRSDNKIFATYCVAHQIQFLCPPPPTFPILNLRDALASVSWNYCSFFRHPTMVEAAVAAKKNSHSSLKLSCGSFDSSDIVLPCHHGCFNFISSFFCVRCDVVPLKNLSLNWTVIVASLLIFFPSAKCSLDYDRQLLHGDSSRDYSAVRGEDVVFRPASAIIVFAIDESGSMAGEHRWLNTTVESLEENLIQSGVGVHIPNRYALVGFAHPGSVRGRVIPVGQNGEHCGSSSEIGEALQNLNIDGQLEDGYSAINVALRSVSCLQVSPDCFQ